MDNRELTDAAEALIGWFNSQSLKPSEAEKIMAKVIAKIICDRMKISTMSAPPSESVFRQELMGNQETLMHELITRIYIIHGRRA